MNIATGILALVMCVALPWVLMKMLVPTLEEHAPHMTNYRSNSVFNGLGAVWLIWTVDLVVLSGFVALESKSLAHLIELAAILAFGACGFGLFDDWAGDSSSKGFKGHVSALLHGRLTTGGLKLLGIGLLSFFIAFCVCFDANDMFSLVNVFLGMCVIGLSTNLLNLFDLRPGRCSKTYTAFLFLWLVAMGISVALSSSANAIGEFGLYALIFVCAMGPVVATWKYDIGERGMLGDSGANPMGALLGFLLISQLSLVGLIIAFVVLLALNMLSEKISFSKIIANTSFLNKIDMWGRKE